MHRARCRGRREGCWLVVVARGRAACVGARLPRTSVCPSSRPVTRSPATSLFSRRLRGKRVALVLVVLIALAITLAMGRFYATRWPTGDLTGVVATGAETALLFRRGDESPYFDVEMVHVDRLEGPEWRKGLYRLQLPPERGVTVGPATITVRASDVDGHLETHAFGRDGTFLWRRRAFEEPRSGWEEGARSHRIGDVVFEVYGGATGMVHLLRVDADSRTVEDSADGDVIGRVDLPGDGPTESRVTPRGLLIRRGDRAWHLGSSARLEPRAERGAVCLVDDGVLVRRDDALVFVPVLGEPEVSIGTLATPEPEAVCLRRGDQFVVATAGALVGFGATSWQQPGVSNLPQPPWIEGEVPSLIGVERDEMLVVHRVSDGRSVASVPHPSGASVRWMGTEGRLYARVGERLWRFSDGVDPIYATIEHGDRFSLSPAHRAPGRIWVANAADARPIDSRSLRPLRSLAQLPRVVTSDAERSPASL